MKSVLLFCIALLCALSATGCSKEPEEETAAAHRPEPLVVLIERNPWLTVVGSDSPTFALYANGLVIFRDSSGRYFSVQLDRRQKNELLSEIEPEAILDLEEEYTASFAFDLPTNELYVWVGGRRKRVEVYGILRADERSPDSGAWNALLDVPPRAFLKAFNAILRFTPEAAPWLPDFIEVLIWPFEYSGEEPLPWPAGWPPLEVAQRATGSDLRQLFLPSSELPTLQKIMKELTPGQAIELGGRKWSIGYRFPFPNEDAWMR